MNKTVAKLLLFHLCPCIISLCIMFTRFVASVLLCVWFFLSQLIFPCLCQILQLALLMQMQALVECISIMDQIMALTPNQLRWRVIFLSCFSSLNLCPLILLPLSILLCMGFHNEHHPSERNIITMIKNRELDNLEQFWKILYQNVYHHFFFQFYVNTVNIVLILH